MNFLYYDREMVYPNIENREGNPDCAYPEYPYGESCISSFPNKVYEAIRNMFHDMKLDDAHYGTKKWNPLGHWIRPANKVVLKPNFVMHANGSKHPDDLDSLVTHRSIIRCLLDYCYIALQGKGEVIVGDAPVKDCDFALLMKRGGYSAIEEFYKRQSDDFIVRFYDFRGPEEEGGQYLDKGDGVVVNLGEKSWFYQCGHDERKYRTPNYVYRRVAEHHTGMTQEYMVNSIVLDADVIINITKPKTHRKNGYTAALKNFVGINYSKEYLPHHTEGAVSDGGDEYIHAEILPAIASRIRRHIDIARVKMGDTASLNTAFSARMAKMKMAFMWRLYNIVNKLDQAWCSLRGRMLNEKAREGSWYGNDTLWRTVLDLNYVLRYAQLSGKVMEHPQRIILHLGDMIISGEKEGPMEPSPKEQHMLLFTDDVVEFDCIVAKVMGFDYKKLVGLKNAIGFKPLTDTIYESITIHSNDKRCTGNLQDVDFSKCVRPFSPSKGWGGHIELDEV